MSPAEREDLQRRVEAARIGLRHARNSLRTALQLVSQLEEGLDRLSTAQPEEAQRNGTEHALAR